MTDTYKIDCSGCSAVDCAVASDSRGHGLESIHRLLLLNIYLMSTVMSIEITKMRKEKETGNGQF